VIELRALREGDDRSQFQSGEPDLDRFAVDFYVRYGFIPLDAIEGQSDARPQPTPMFLSVRAIRDSGPAPR
jgi:hypothetical protein